ncbi:MAG TPA: hypothetical protein VLS48_04165 [Anaerolineales bacterium]|nr:hypothetical protein [Anaerolineales bacterium]
MFLLFLAGVFAWQAVQVAAQSPDRQTTIIVEFTQYQWWLSRWDDNSIQCIIEVDHAGLPEAAEVIHFCGDTVYAEWTATPPCEIDPDAGETVSDCDGLYLHLVGKADRQREVVVQLPPPEVFVTLEGCSPTPPENLCPEIPRLLLTAEEPLPNERITSIEGLIDANPFVCEGGVCALPLEATTRAGVLIEFWANSSYGDSSERYSARVRVIDTGVAPGPDGGGYYVDVISSQWRGADLASCARAWGAFPPVGAGPTWLSTPVDSQLLASDEPYFYLAGRLIFQGVVDAQDCPSGGLLPNGYANACGLERSRPVVEPWQNQFDARILEVAQDTSIPAQIMKNLFAQESQFWPGVFRVPYEFGLGQLTDNGADSVLLWNDSFFAQFCPLVLAEDACGRGYLKLSEDERAILRGALALEVNANCEDCPLGIDLTNVDFSVALFAETLLANCEQVGQIVFTATDSLAGEVASYEDLWRFTIANYHAGPGCLSYAVHTAWDRGGVLTWEQVAQDFTDPCKGVVPYVEKITNVGEVPLLSTASADLTATPVIITPTAGAGAATPVIPTPTGRVLPTVTQEAYPAPAATATPEAYPVNTPVPTRDPYAGP